MTLRAFIAGAAILGLAAATAAAADMEPRAHSARRTPHKGCCEEAYRFVYAEGWYGSAKLVAPVRHGEFGDEVFVEGVGWQHCALSCEETLRKQNLSYWRDLIKQRKAAEQPDYPRRDFYIDGWGIRHDYLF